MRRKNGSQAEEEVGLLQKDYYNDLFAPIEGKSPIHQLIEESNGREKIKKPSRLQRIQQVLYGTGKFLMAGMISVISVLKTIAEKLKPLKALPFAIVVIDLLNTLTNVVPAWIDYSKGKASLREAIMKTLIGLFMLSLLTVALLGPLVFPPLAAAVPFLFLSLLTIGSILFVIFDFKKSQNDYRNATPESRSGKFADYMLNAIEACANVALLACFIMFAMTPIGNIAALGMVGIVLGVVAVRGLTRFVQWLMPDNGRVELPADVNLQTIPRNREQSENTSRPESTYTESNPKSFETDNLLGLAEVRHSTEPSTNGQVNILDMPIPSSKSAEYSSASAVPK